LSHFAEEVLRNDAVHEEPTTVSREIPSPSGAGIVKPPLSKDLVGGRTLPFREIRSMYGGDVDTISSVGGRLPNVRSLSSGFVPPNSELLSVPARRSLSGVFGASEIRLNVDGFDPSWNQETLRSFSAGQSQPFDPPYHSSPQTSVGVARVGDHGGNPRFVPGFVDVGLSDCHTFSMSQHANLPVNARDSFLPPRDRYVPPPPSDHPRHPGNASEMGQWVRFGREDQRNITQRDTKRPKERSRDKVYKNRFSMSSSIPSNYGSPDAALPSQPPTGGFSWPRDGRQPTSTPPLVGVVWGQDPFSGQGPPPSGMGGGTGQQQQDPSFEVHLIFEGTMLSFRVWPTMAIQQLILEAGRIFGLDSNDIILVLFSSVPTSLCRDGFIHGPDPGARIMVFNVPGAPAPLHPHNGGPTDGQLSVCAS
jgi:hypothetical protein